MATIPAITVPNPVAQEVLDALEKLWKPDAVRVFGQATYDAMGGPEKAQACIIAMIRVSVRNSRREAAERLVAADEPEVT